MSPEESAAPDSDGTQTPTHAENLACLAALKARNASLRQEYRDLVADLDRMQAAVDKPRGRSLWPWAVSIGMGIMITGNVLLAVSDYIPANLHAKGTSFALAMIAYFINCLAFFRLVRTKSLSEEQCMPPPRVTAGHTPAVRG